MKTATQGFVLASSDLEARQIAPGRTIAGAEFPPQLRWWLTSGGLLRQGSRPRRLAGGAPPIAPAPPAET
ncbi:MAG: hypothetical protein IT438_10390 [Phycisphaerales bacterium]|nr:hypothetical protein [Phycisphaerales bacterium]